MERNHSLIQSPQNCKLLHSDGLGSMNSIKREQASNKHGVAILSSKGYGNLIIQRDKEIGLKYKKEKRTIEIEQSGAAPTTNPASRQGRGWHSGCRPRPCRPACRLLPEQHCRRSLCRHQHRSRRLPARDDWKDRCIYNSQARDANHPQLSVHNCAGLCRGTHLTRDK
jgi:hypothetical protein